MSAVVFQYRARSGSGDAVRGSMTAPDEQAVIRALRARALLVTSVERPHTVFGVLTRAAAIGRSRRRARLTFYRSLATLLRAGVPIRRAFDVTIERTGDRGLREALLASLADIELGASLSVALARRSHVFGSLQIAMIAAGEAGGILDDVLERLAYFLEREAELRSRVHSALAYPTVVLGAAGSLVMFLVVRIAPMFREMFASFHVALPLPTRLLLALSEGLEDVRPWMIACMGVTGALLVLLSVRTRMRFAPALDSVRLRIPILGPLLKRVITARFARTLATLLRAGVELVIAVESVTPVTGSVRYAAALGAVATALQAGDALSASLERSQVFDPLLVALVRVGEETGTLDAMLMKVAEYFEADVDAAVATLGSAIEPLLIGALGLVVGFIVFSVFLPLYSLIGSMSK